MFYILILTIMLYGSLYCFISTEMFNYVQKTGIIRRIIMALLAIPLLSKYFLFIVWISLIDLPFDKLNHFLLSNFRLYSIHHIVVGRRRKNYKKIYQNAHTNVHQPFILVNSSHHFVNDYSSKICETNVR